MSQKIEPITNTDEVGELYKSLTAMQDSFRRLTSVANKISEGDLSEDFTADPENELASTFSRMRETLKTLMQDLTKSMTILSKSSEDILQITSQMASSVAETGAAVSQTSASTTEIKAVAHDVAKSANEVASESNKALTVSRAGRMSVEKALDAIQKNKIQMESISGSVRRLSEHNQTVQEITSSVTSIAEQSNILAVNASIEAAKAGELGKGFNVLAQQINNLASQSKQATYKIKKILRDVQISIEDTVEATSEGIRVANEAATLTLSADESIKKLYETIVSANRISVEIAEKNEMQVQKLDQVAAAMRDIREASVLNGTSARSAENVAQDLHNLGGRMRVLVERYHA